MKFIVNFIQQIKFYVALSKKRRELKDEDPYIYK
jgi:hypothetical protein